MGLRFLVVPFTEVGVASSGWLSSSGEGVGCRVVVIGGEMSGHEGGGHGVG
jgi:hypothetical protein